jgi:hypothetical protein
MVVGLEDPSLPSSQLDAPVAAPMIVRVAGLPGEVLAPFSSAICASHLAALARLEQELADRRTRLIDSLAEALPSFPPSSRRFLLTVKRDVFNARGLRRHSDKPEWPELLRASVGLVGQVIALEESVDQARQALGAAYERELERERIHLLSLLHEPNLMRGIALGNPEMVAKARRLPEIPFGQWGRRERKIEQTLLRFATRTAAKLSPYSTLTAVALGTIREGSDLAGLGAVAGERRATSLVRVNRSLLDRCQELLLRHPLIRGRFQVALNDTAREAEPGRFRFLRNGHWEIDASTGGFRFVPASYVSAQIGGPLIPLLQSALAGGPRGYDWLTFELANRDGRSLGAGEDRIRTSVDGLISVGFLQLLPPWPTHEVHLERRMLAFLRSIDAPELQELGDLLERLVERELAHANEPLPERSVTAIHQALGDFVQEVEHLDASSCQVGRGELLYEDVVLLPSEEAGTGIDLYRISSAEVEEILSNAELIWRFASVFNHRHDFLHTLAAFWAERWPGQREIAFLDLFDAAHELWKDYLRFDHRLRNDELGSFNPLQLAAIDRLGDLRCELSAKAGDLFEGGPSGCHLPREKFKEILAGIPPRYRPLLGCSVFVQPTTADAEEWVLNRLFEGTGRYLSRYIAGFPEPARSSIAAHFEERSIIEVEGEPAELLDIMFTQGSMVSLRVPQTTRVVEFPGERIDLPAERRVRLSDLEVQVDLTAESFRVVDSRGYRLIPVHMSSLNFPFVPLLQRFLSIFGPYETRQIFPRPQPVTAGTVQVSDRLLCGNLVVRRKRWQAATETIRDHVGDLRNASDNETFQRVDHWRRAIGLPARVFLYEQMHRDGDVVQSFKPQYLDFSSPSYTSLFLSILGKQGTRTMFEEPLPSFSEFPVDDEHARRALELQIDSLALRQATLSEARCNGVDVHQFRC